MEVLVVAVFNDEALDSSRSTIGTSCVVDVSVLSAEACCLPFLSVLVCELSKAGRGMGIYKR